MFQLASKLPENYRGKKATKMRVLAFGGLGNLPCYFANMEKVCAQQGIYFRGIDIHKLTPTGIDGIIADFIINAKGNHVILGFSSSCYAVAEAFNAHKSSRSKLLLIDPPYILGPGEVSLPGIHAYYRDVKRPAEIPKDMRAQVLSVLAPSDMQRLFYRALNLCPPLQWAMRACGSRSCPSRVEYAIYSMPLERIQAFLKRFILAYDPVHIIDHLLPSDTCILCTTYHMSRTFVQKRAGPVSGCVRYIDAGHHVLHDHPQLVCASLHALCATSTP